MTTRLVAAIALGLTLAGGLATVAIKRHWVGPKPEPRECYVAPVVAPRYTPALEKFLADVCERRNGERIVRPLHADEVRNPVWDWQGGGPDIPSIEPRWVQAVVGGVMLDYCRLPNNKVISQSIYTTAGRALHQQEFFPRTIASRDRFGDWAPNARRPPTRGRQLAETWMQLLYTETNDRIFKDGLFLLQPKFWTNDPKADKECNNKEVQKALQGNPERAYIRTDQDMVYLWTQGHSIALSLTLITYNSPVTEPGEKFKGYCTTL